NVMTQVTREGPPPARVGFGADEDSVTACGVGPVLHDGADVFLVTHLRETPAAQFVGDEQVRVETTRFHITGLGQVGDGGAHRPGQGRFGDPGDDQGRPVHGDPVVAVTALDLDLVDDPCANHLITQTIKGCGGASGLGPTGQRSSQIGRARPVGVGVECDVEAVTDGGFVDGVEHLGGPAPVQREVDVAVCKVQGDLGPSGHVEAFPVGLHHSGPVIAVVRAVVADRITHRCQECDDFLVVGVHAGGVGQPRGEPVCAFGHALGDLGDHPFEFGTRGWAVLPTEYVHPDVAVRDEVGDVDGCPFVHALEVFTDGAPGTVQLGGAVPSGE